MTNDENTCIHARLAAVPPALRDRELTRGLAANGSTQPIDPVLADASVTRGSQLSAGAEKLRHGPECDRSDGGVGPAIGEARR
jgi:hypothetical protein